MVVSVFFWQVVCITNSGGGDTLDCELYFHRKKTRPLRLSQSVLPGLLLLLAGSLFTAGVSLGEGEPTEQAASPRAAKWQSHLAETN